MKNYNIIHTWEHSEGHTVRDNFNKTPIQADSPESAVEKFKEINPKLGQFIKPYLDGSGYYYGHRGYKFLSGDKIHTVEAIEIK